jgi:hypothetical protein
MYLRRRYKALEAAHLLYCLYTSFTPPLLPLYLLYTSSTVSIPPLYLLYCLYIYT